MISESNKVYLLLGGNLGDIKQIFTKAISEISIRIGVIITQSSLYASPPWGFESKNDFLNQVLEVDSALSAQEVLSMTQNIEIELGRKRNPEATTFESRTIDIDILYFNSEVQKTECLVLPHYALHERKFTLLPLVEIAPEYLHPVLKKTNKQLLSSCKDQSPVNQI